MTEDELLNAIEKLAEKSGVVLEEHWIDSGIIREKYVDNCSGCVDLRVKSIKPPRLVYELSNGNFIVVECRFKNSYLKFLHEEDNLQLKDLEYLIVVKNELFFNKSKDSNNELLRKIGDIND